MRIVVVVSGCGCVFVLVFVFVFVFVLTLPSPRVKKMVRQRQVINPKILHPNIKHRNMAPPQPLPGPIRAHRLIALILHSEAIPKPHPPLNTPRIDAGNPPEVPLGHLVLPDREVLPPNGEP